jgi:hypothetical protein
VEDRRRRSDFQECLAYGLDRDEAYDLTQERATERYLDAVWQALMDYVKSQCP